MFSLVLYMVAGCLHCALALRDALHAAGAVSVLPAIIPRRVLAGLFAGLPELFLAGVYFALGLAPHL